MKKILTYVFIAAILLVFAACSTDYNDNPHDYEYLPKGPISEYLPITLEDQFRLGFLGNYPIAKTDFTNAELMVIYNAVSSLYPFGSSPPWGDRVLYGIMWRPILHASGETYETELWFVDWAYPFVVSASVNNEPVQWFTVDSAAFSGIVNLIRNYPG